MLLLFAALASSIDGSSIPSQMHGAWVPVDAQCSSEVDMLVVSRDRLEWYEATGYLQLGIEFDAGGIEKGFYAKLIGTNIDAIGDKFWESSVRMEALQNRLRIIRYGEADEELAEVEYKPCP